MDQHEIASIHALSKDIKNTYRPFEFENKLKQKFGYDFPDHQQGYERRSIYPIVELDDSSGDGENENLFLDIGFQNKNGCPSIGLSVGSTNRSLYTKIDEAPVYVQKAIVKQMAGIRYWFLDQFEMDEKVDAALDYVLDEAFAEWSTHYPYKNDGFNSQETMFKRDVMYTFLSIEYGIRTFNELFDAHDNEIEKSHAGKKHVDDEEYIVKKRLDACISYLGNIKAIHYKTPEMGSIGWKYCELFAVKNGLMKVLGHLQKASLVKLQKPFKNYEKTFLD